MQDPKPYLDSLFDLIFQGLSRLFVLSFENHTKYYIPTIEIKYYNVMIYDQLLKNQLKIIEKTYDNFQKIAICQGDDYTIVCLLNLFNKYYKMITIDLCKQQAADSDPKAIQQINFTGNLARDLNANTICFSLLKKQKIPF